MSTYEHSCITLNSKFPLLPRCNNEDRICCDGCLRMLSPCALLFQVYWILSWFSSNYVVMVSWKGLEYAVKGFQVGCYMTTLNKGKHTFEVQKVWSSFFCFLCIECLCTYYLFVLFTPFHKLICSCGDETHAERTLYYLFLNSIAI